MALKRRRTSLDLPEHLDREIIAAADRAGQTKVAFIRTCILIGIRWHDDRREVDVKSK